MWNSLIDSDPSAQIPTAWIAKEELGKLFALARTNTSRDQISSRLHVFYDWCASAEIDDLDHPGHHRGNVVANDRSIHLLRRHQRPHRRHQSPSEKHQALGVRVPQCN
jgi:hypothetical protein